MPGDGLAALTTGEIGQTPLTESTLAASDDNEPNPRTVYDSIFVGSSPVLLLEALHLSRQGQRVGILEARPNLGGAWYARNLWNVGNIDVGTHYIEPGQYTNHLLRDVLGITCDPQQYDIMWCAQEEPDDDQQSSRSLLQRIEERLKQTLVQGRLIPVDKWLLITAIFHNSVATVRKPSPKAVLNNLRNIGSALARFFSSRTPRLYPRQGCHGIVSALRSRIEETSIRVFTDARVDRVVVGEAGAPNECHAGKSMYLARHVITGQNVPFDLVVDGSSSQGELHIRFWVHTILKVKGTKRRPFDFIDLRSSNPPFKRIQDVTSQALEYSNLQRDELLICCQSENNSRPPQSEQQAQEMLKTLKEIKLLSGDAQLIEWHSELFSTRCDDNRDRVQQMVPSLHPSVRVMRTYDLGACIEQNRDRWGSLG